MKHIEDVYTVHTQDSLLLKIYHTTWAYTTNLEKNKIASLGALCRHSILQLSFNLTCIAPCIPLHYTLQGSTVIFDHMISKFIA